MHCPWPWHPCLDTEELLASVFSGACVQLFPDAIRVLLHGKETWKDFVNWGIWFFPLGPNAVSRLAKWERKEEPKCSQRPFICNRWYVSPAVMISFTMLATGDKQPPSGSGACPPIKTEGGSRLARGKAMEWRFGVSKHRSVNFWYQEFCSVPSTVPLCALSILKGLEYPSLLWKQLQDGMDNWWGSFQYTHLHATEALNSNNIIP